MGKLNIHDWLIILLFVSVVGNIYFLWPKERVVNKTFSREYLETKIKAEMWEKNSLYHEKKADSLTTVINKLQSHKNIPVTKQKKEYEKIESINNNDERLSYLDSIYNAEQR